MTPEKITKFKADFKSLVYTKGMVTEANNKIKQLSRWDRDGSHEKAIVKAIEKRDKIKKDYTEKLKGKRYEQWKDFSRKISTLNSRLNKAIERQKAITDEINNLTF